MTYLAHSTRALAISVAILVTAQAAQAVPYSVDLLGSTVAFLPGAAPTSFEGVSQLYQATPTQELGAADLFNTFFGSDSSVAVNLDIPASERPELTFVAVTFQFADSLSTFFTRIDGFDAFGNPYVPESDWNNKGIEFDSLTWAPTTLASIESITLYGRTSVPAVPDQPATWALMGISALGLGALARRRQRAA